MLSLGGGGVCYPWGGGMLSLGGGGGGGGVCVCPGGMGYDDLTYFSLMQSASLGEFPTPLHTYSQD